MKRVTALNAVLADWDEGKLPNGDTKFFSVGFIYGYRNKEKILPKFRELVSFVCDNDTINRVLPIYLNDAVQLGYE